MRYSDSAGDSPMERPKSIAIRMFAGDPWYAFGTRDPLLIVFAYCICSANVS